MKNWKAILFPFILFATLTGAMIDPNAGGGGGCAGAPVRQDPGAQEVQALRDNSGSTPQDTVRNMDQLLRQRSAQKAQTDVPARDAGTTRTLAASTMEAHSAAEYVLGRYRDNGWYVQDYGTYLTAQQIKTFFVSKLQITISPALAEGSVDVQCVASGNGIGITARGPQENDILNNIAETLTARKGAALKTSDEPQEQAALAVASDVDKIGKFTEKDREDDFAVVVGIEKYQNIPKADYAERDAQTMKKYFEALGVPEENIILLTGDKAGKNGLTKYLEEWLPKNVTADSRVYFYYSGHGAPNPADSTAYLVPWDGDPSYLPSTAYPVTRLYEKLAALKAKQVIVMLDSCFSGAGGRSVIAQGARPLVNVVTTVVPTSSRITVLSASSGDQISGTINAQAHGMFTYYLLKGLKGAADPDDSGHVSLDALYTYVKKSVQKAAHRDNREQTPELHGANPELRLY